MDRLWPTLFAAACAVAALYLMYFGWKRRSRRDSDLAVLHEIPADVGELLTTVSGFYVATTVHENPFERLAVRGLGFRGRAAIDVTTSGVIVRIPGEDPIYFPAAAIERIAQATWAIDRVVETNGLMLLAWRLTSSDAAVEGGAVIVDSYFRVIEVDDRVKLIAAVERIAPSAGKAHSTTDSGV
jgi:hypothetical protein